MNQKEAAAPWRDNAPLSAVFQVPFWNITRAGLQSDRFPLPTRLTSRGGRAKQVRTELNDAVVTFSINHIPNAVVAAVYDA